METALGLVGLVAGAVSLLRYLVSAPFFVRYLRRARVRSIPKGETPPISLIKPVYGDEPGLEERLVATLRQNYPVFEVIFVHERRDDPALRAVEAASRRVPDVSVRTVAGREIDAANPKTAVILRGAAVARYDLVATADSDVHPDPLYLRDIANGLAEHDLVSFVPVFFGMRTIWARLVGLLYDTDPILAVIVSGGNMTTGSTIGVRREALEAVGGYEVVADKAADDYALGVAFREAGRRVGLARRAARVHMPGGGFRDTLRFLLRWGRVIRTAAPFHFLVSVPLLATPLLLVLTALLTRFHAAALWMLLGHALARGLVAIAIDLRFAWDRSLVRALPLLPLGWLWEPLLMAAASLGRTVVWRGRRYSVRRGDLARDAE